MTTKIKIKHNSVQETLIIPLYARKKCSDKFPHLYQDPMATEICSRLDYDFSELDRKYETKAYEFGSMEGALRQMDMMAEISDYLKSHPNASIICLGCGLDFDPRRCGGENNKIYNLDFPDVIAAREELA
ncbi:MAG: class I SAM-dependent methyltransferase, partial [Lachnospiraceae bacterium]|nr:class I SAM-dependent methyltransferase [Lachnospiraceae bacterium]